MSRRPSSVSAASSLTLSMANLPNLPGVKRNLTTANPGLYKQFKAANPAGAELVDSMFGQQVENDYQSIALDQLGDNDSQLTGDTRIFPVQAQTPNDITGRYALVSQRQDRANNVRSLPFSRPESVPSFATGERKVCRFVAYFKELVEGHGKESERIHAVELTYYVDDSTMEIIEPKTADSGFIQGKLLRRHRVPKPTIGRPIQSRGGTGGSRTGSSGPKPEDYYSLNDIYSGAELDIYRTKYIVVACDTFTRGYYRNSLCVDFGPNGKVPENTYRSRHAEAMSRGQGNRSEASTAGGSPMSIHQQQQMGAKINIKEYSAGFYEYERQVLRFYCLWDNRKQLYGDVMKVRLHFYLADEMIEVLPLSGEKQNGRDKLPKYLKKTRVPKPDQDNGMRSGAPNASAFMSFNSNASLTVIEPIVPTVQYYQWHDLKIGSIFKIASIELLLVDADDFTKQFFATRGMPMYTEDAPLFGFQGLDDGVSSKVRRDEPKSPDRMPALTSPGGGTRSVTASTTDSGFNSPTRGNTALFNSDSQTESPTNIGGESENAAQAPGDTSMVMVGLAPPVPKRDGAKLVAYQGVVLRFVAVLRDGKPGEELRQFVIQIMLEDDTIQIREPPQRNTGFNGGIFLRRVRMNDKMIPFGPRDVYVGAKLRILSHQFEVIEADEFTMHYMESNEGYRSSNPNSVLMKIKQFEPQFKKVCLTMPNLAQAYVTEKDVISMFARIGVKMNKQEVLTVFRQVEMAGAADDASSVVSSPTRGGERRIKLTKVLKYILSSNVEDIYQ